MHRLKILDGPFVYVILCAVGLLLYFKSFFFGFTYLDDNALILNNLPFLEDIGNVFQAFTRDAFFMIHSATAYFRPLLTISFMPEAIFGGSLAFLYHFVNVGIHLAAACLVYALFGKLKYPKRVSFLVALVFVAHPVLTQAVAWIPGRNDSLLAVFVLASFIYFLKFIDEGKRRSILWSVFFFSLALFTKETAVVLPVLCLGYLWMRDILTKSTLTQFSAGWLAAIALWLPLRFIAMNSPLPMSVHGVISTFLENAPGAVPLLGKVFFPFNLSVLPILQDSTFVWGYIAAAFMAGLLFWRMRGKQNIHLMLFGLAWFALFCCRPLSSPIRQAPHISLNIAYISR